jgi:hypothetical protein
VSPYYSDPYLVTHDDEYVCTCAFDTAVVISAQPEQGTCQTVPPVLAGL